MVKISCSCEKDDKRIFRHFKSKDGLYCDIDICRNCAQYASLAMLELAQWIVEVERQETAEELLDNVTEDGK